jgi:hypothetical protein
MNDIQNIAFEIDVAHGANAYITSYIEEKKTAYRLESTENIACKRTKVKSNSNQVEEICYSYIFIILLSILFLYALFIKHLLQH